MPQSRSLFGQNCVSRNLTGRREKTMVVPGKINETSNTGEHSVILKEQNILKRTDVVLHNSNFINKTTQINSPFFNHEL